ncbi:hypothetical protein B0H13DRAFT_1983448 [Mycena leptocephala]|nr:hypothetical protein B0H13DRAFT_1983448 [Mycena leptocephala]
MSGLKIISVPQITSKSAFHPHPHPRVPPLCFASKLHQNVEFSVQRWGWRAVTSTLFVALGAFPVTPFPCPVRGAAVVRWASWVHRGRDAGSTGCRVEIVRRGALAATAAGGRMGMGRPLPDRSRNLDVVLNRVCAQCLCTTEAVMRNQIALSRSKSAHSDTASSLIPSSVHSTLAS